MSNFVIIALTAILLVFALALVVSVDYRGTGEDEEPGKYSEMERHRNAERPEETRNANDPKDAEEDEEDTIGFYLVGDRKKQKME